jgi:hypothetical protein
MYHTLSQQQYILSHTHTSVSLSLSALSVSLSLWIIKIITCGGWALMIAGKILVHLHIRLKTWTQLDDSFSSTKSEHSSNCVQGDTKFSYNLPSLHGKSCTANCHGRQGLPTLAEWVRITTRNPSLNETLLTIFYRNAIFQPAFHWSMFLI